jgi:hypothetical protein
VSENRVLRKIFRPEEEVAGGWRRLHNKVLHNLYASQNIIRKINDEKGRTCSMHMRDEKSIQYFEGHPREKRSLGRLRRRWEHNIRTDRREIAWEVVDWMHLGRDVKQWWTLVNMVTEVRVP